MLLKLDSISWLKTLQISHNFMQWPVVNTLFQGKMHHYNQEDVSSETQKLDPCWKLRPVACMVNMESRLEFGLWAETILTLGLEFLMDQIGLWWIRITTTQKIPRDQLEEHALQPDVKGFAYRSKAKANKEENLLALHQESFPWKGIGLILNQGNILSLRVRSLEEINSSSSSFSASTSRRGWSGSFLEKSKKIFRTDSQSLFIGWTIEGKHA